jgi:hypothetical protein
MTNEFDDLDDWEPAGQPPSTKNRWRAQIRQKLSDCEAAAPIMQRTSLKVSDIWSRVKGSLPIIFLPPFALLIAGYIIGWVAQGFRARA